ncbi:dihydrofolate reductase family protein [Nigerium massiliense]|uniref:dihydrofolate reductase family protein n=1 Tax=Nigerium massiliense TaxID=1522317 RepID=UPI0006941473
MTASSALEAGLVDELLIHVAPIMLGSGIPLFRGTQHRLRLVETVREGETVTLRLRPTPNA